jgi:hypothetical protein
MQPIDPSCTCGCPTFYDLAGRELTGKDNPFGLPGLDTLRAWKEDPPAAKVQ